MTDATQPASAQTAAVTDGYYGGVATHISSPDESYALFIQNDGRVEVRHNGTHVRWL